VQQQDRCVVAPCAGDKIADGTDVRPRGGGRRPCKRPPSVATGTPAEGGRGDADTGGRGCCCWVGASVGSSREGWVLFVLLMLGPLLAGKGGRSLVAEDEPVVAAVAALEFRERAVIVPPEASGATGGRPTDEADGGRREGTGVGDGGADADGGRVVVAGTGAVVVVGGGSGNAVAKPPMAGAGRARRGGPVLVP